MITEQLNIPTLGYGAGAYCDGQGLVAHDIIGYFDRFTPKFAKKYADVSKVILEAFKTYIGEVTTGQFPSDEHSFHIKTEELEKLKLKQ